MTEPCACGRATSGGSELCQRCGRTLAHALANIAAYYDDLDTVATKQVRYGLNGSARAGIGQAQPLPVDLRFVNGARRREVRGRAVGGPATAPGSQLRWDARNTVSTWCRVVMDEQPQVLGPVCATRCLHSSCHLRRRRAWPRDTIRSMCLYLDRQHHWIEHRDFAAVLLDELTNLEQRLARMINSPPERWYAGKCDCGVDLYADRGRAEVACPDCGARYDVAVRREFLLTEARHYLVTATEAAGALLAWTDYAGNETNLVRLISQWHQHGRLVSRGEARVNGRDRHLYRLGDVQELLVRHAQRQQDRRLSG